MANYNLVSKNSDLETFQVFDNFFPDEFLKVIYEFNQTQTWGFYEDSNILSTNLHNLDFFEKDCVDYINWKTGVKHELYRCYRSGTLQTNIGASHYDTHDKGDRTLVYYGHDYWELEWGGETTFGENHNVYIQPIPNSAVYFSAKHHKHCVRPPNHMAKKLRITYMWKLKSL